MYFFHFIDKTKLESILETGILPEDSYRGKGILLYPDIDIKFRCKGTDPHLLKEELELNQMAHFDKWKLIATLGLKQKNKIIAAVKIQLDKTNWPLNVFIDIHSEIAKDFAQLYDRSNLNAVKLEAGETYSNFIESIESPRFVLEENFTVHSKEELNTLIFLFQKAGGGIWGAHSFDCLTNKRIDSKHILEIVN